LTLKILKRLRTASLNSEFTGLIKKVNQGHKISAAHELDIVTFHCVTHKFFFFVQNKLE